MPENRNEKEMLLGRLRTLRGGRRYVMVDLRTLTRLLELEKSGRRLAKLGKKVLKATV